LLAWWTWNIKLFFYPAGLTEAFTVTKKLFTPQKLIEWVVIDIEDKTKPEDKYVAYSSDANKPSSSMDSEGITYQYFWKVLGISRHQFQVFIFDRRHFYIQNTVDDAF
jgi:hypothetical protein